MKTKPKLKIGAFYALIFVFMICYATVIFEDIYYIVGFVFVLFTFSTILLIGAYITYKKEIDTKGENEIKKTGKIMFVEDIKEVE